MVGTGRLVAALVPRPATRAHAGPRRAPSLPRGPDPHAGQLELQARARAFVRDVLQPLEAEFERAGGRLPREGGPDPRARRSRPGSTAARSRRASAARAGQSLEQVLVHEQLGQATGGLWSFIPGAYNALIHCDAGAAARATSSRACAANGSGATRSPSPAPAPTPGPSPPRRSATPATGDYVLNGEKWFVTGPPDDTDFMIFHCVVVDGDRAPADAVPRRLRHARRDDDPRPRLHAHVRRPPPAVRADGRPRARRRRCSAGSARPTS